MQPRGAATVVIGIVLMLAQPGCVLLTGTETTKEAAGNLPPRETARLSVAVGESLVSDGHFPEAILQYQKARALDPKIDVSAVLARLYASVGEAALAREEYRKALESHPQDANLWNDFGYYHYSLGDWIEAEKALRKAVELDPQSARAWTNLGLTLGQQQRYQDSLAAFGRAISPAEAYCNLGFVLATQGKMTQAQEAYRTALKLNPRLPLARSALAKLERPGNSRATVAAKPAGDRAVSSLPPIATSGEEE